MTFKQMLENDIKNVFLNTEELAEIHNVEGFTVSCILQGDISKNGELYANYSNMLIIRAKDLPGRKRNAGDTLIIDNVIFTIESCDNQAGILYITLTAPEQY